MGASSHPGGIPDHYVRCEPSWKGSWKMLGIGIIFVGLIYVIVVRLMIERFNYQRWVVLLIILVPFTVLIHELLHAVPAWVAGLQLTGGIEHRRFFSLTPYVMPYGGVITRSQALVITGLPVVGVTLLALSATVTGTGWIDSAAWIVLFYNTLGSVVNPESDLQQATLLAHLPAGTLIYTAHDGEKMFYRPPEST